MQVSVNRVDFGSRHGMLSQSADLLGHRKMSHPLPYMRVKRVLDLILLLIVFVPANVLILFGSILSMIEHRSNPIFRQARIGYLREEIIIYKIKTMRDSDSDECENSRLTYTGKILRIFGIDEIPQIYNVLAGNMSFVGPRPILSKEIINIKEKYNARFEVLPGITGLDQININSNITNLSELEKKFDNDVLYIEKFGFWTDIYIIAKTFLFLLTFRGFKFRDRLSEDIVVRKGI